MLAKQLTIGFSETEDRLVVLASDGPAKGVALALTRRLTGRLINGLATMLERSSPVATTAPAEVRDDIILMEHQGALTGTGEGARGTGASASVQIKAVPRLVTKITITSTPADFRMALFGPDIDSVGLTLSRTDLHRVVEALKRKAEAADWHIQIDASWLDPDQSDIVLQ
jgi:hypothetical protein